MNAAVTVRAHAKINWALRITGKRPDGFHDLETVFQEISLADSLTFEPAAATSLSCDDPRIPADESNLVLRAARAIDAPPVKITLQKRIPAEGGLGGGSSDAAATLRTLNEMFHLEMDDRLPDIAMALGSDVPFFLAGGCAYATGRGEELRPLEAARGAPILLVIPDERVSTAEAFRSLHHFSVAAGYEAFEEAAADFLAAPELLINDFEEPIFARLPRLREIRDRLIEAGAAKAAMSGSGSTMFGVFRDAAARDRAAGAFADLRTERVETL